MNEDNKFANAVKIVGKYSVLFAATLAVAATIGAFAAGIAAGAGATMTVQTSLAAGFGIVSAIPTFYSLHSLTKNVTPTSLGQGIRSHVE